MKLGVIGIIIEDRTFAESVNKLLSEYGDSIIGRMGIPDRANGVFVISVIVRAENETVSAFSGKLGRLKGVKVKSAVTDADVAV